MFCFDTLYKTRLSRLEFYYKVLKIQWNENVIIIIINAILNPLILLLFRARGSTKIAKVLAFASFGNLEKYFLINFLVFLI